MLGGWRICSQDFIDIYADISGNEKGNVRFYEIQVYKTCMESSSMDVIVYLAHKCTLSYFTYFVLESVLKLSYLPCAE